MGFLLVLQTFGKPCPGFIPFYLGGHKFYMVGIAALCWAVWITRNKVMFEGYVVRLGMAPAGYG